MKNLLLVILFLCTIIFIFDIGGKKINAKADPFAYEMDRVTYPPWTGREQRIRFVRLAVALLGTPYKKGGVNGAGIDCSGLVFFLYRTFEIYLPRTTKNQFLVGRPIPRAEIEEADLIFFNGDDKPLHVGIYLGDGKFIHSSSAAKQVRIDFIDSGSQYRHFIGAIRIRDLHIPKEVK